MNQQKISKLLLILFVFFSITCFARKDPKMDERIKNMKKSFFAVLYSNPDSSLIVLRNSLNEFDEDPNVISWKYNLKGTYFYNKQKADSSIFYFKLSLKNLDIENNLYLFNENRVLLSSLYRVLGKYEKAYEELEISNNELRKYKIVPKSVRINLLRGYGNYYNDQQKFEKSITAFLTAIDIIEKDTIQRDNVKVNLYVNLGELFSNLNDLVRSNEYFQKGYDLSLKEGLEFSSNHCKFNLLRNYYRTNNSLDTSTLNEVLSYFEKNNRFTHVIECKSLMGEVNLIARNYDEAELIYLDVLIICKKIKYYIGTVNTQINLGKVYNLKVDFIKSYLHLNDALKLSSAIGSLPLQESILNELSKVYFNEKKYDKAYEYLNKWSIIKDSILITDRKLATAELEEKYQSDQKEKEIALLKSKNELVQQQQLTQKYLLLGGIIITTLVGLFFFLQFRNRKKINENLRNLDNIKTKFFTNISHEFRTPLTLISGPVQRQLSNPDLQGQERKDLEMVSKNTDKLLGLVNQLLDISKLESKKLMLKVSKQKLFPYVNTLIEGFEFSAIQKGIQFNINIVKNESESFFDKDIIEKLITNLLSNAVKYTPTSGSININVSVKETFFVFSIKNIGSGLSKDQLKKIFDRFYQVDDHQQGTGVGLALVKELVSLHKGKIGADSEIDKWISFRFEIPLEKSSYDKDEIVLPPIEGNPISNDKNFYSNDISEVEDVTSENDKPILLIVEDNDDVRTYLNSIFNSMYDVLLAENGHIGIDMAIENIPDVIISDIMMPVKDGIELCNTLKSDIRTNHIPILLLTAKAGQENELEGVISGADGYITKPFNEDILKAKVNNLFQNIEKLQKRFSQEIVLRPVDVSINSTEELFLGTLQTVLDENLVEPTFNVEMFCQKMGMSRMQLHRKLKALFGLSSSEFIRNERLKKAAELLKKSDVMVSQIGYAVGFNDHAYFSKRFKEKYNSTPSDYSKSFR